jgi:hypothetical protein
MRFLKTDNDGSSGNGHSGQQNTARLFTPGAWVFFDDKYLDQVVDTYEDGTYCYIQWRNTTDWPFTPVLKLKAHPCPDFTINNCTGTAVNLESFNAAPNRAPMFSYAKNTYIGGPSGATAVGIPSFPFLLGTLQSIKMNVTAAYTGTLTHRFSQFNNWPIQKSDYSTINIGASVINMHLTGLRTVLPNSAGTGAQSGDTLDSLSSSGALWMYRAQNNGAVFSANVVNGETPTIVVEFTTDQGIPPAIPVAVAPLRLRLYAA